MAAESHHIKQADKEPVQLIKGYGLTARARSPTMEYKFMDLRKASAYDVLYCAKAMHGGHA